MNTHLLNSEIQDFIEANLNSKVTSILLKKISFNQVSLAEIAEQLDAKQRCRKKIPSWYSTPKIYYPNKLNIEQASSERTAQYKSKLLSGNTIIDITGGMGVDSYYFGQQFKKVIHCEIDKKLSAIVNYNFSTLNVKNIEVIHADGLAYLAQSKKKFDCIYIDPSRRHDVKGKVFFLKDCLPNISEHLDLLLEHSERLLIKTSPMLDISRGILELKYVKEVHCVATDHEVKELLFIIEKGFEGDVLIKAVNLSPSSQNVFGFHQSEEQNAKSILGAVDKYIFEPHVALLKSGAFKIISNRLSIKKLHKHSHLYTASELQDFPGRIFKVERVISYNKRLLKKEIYKLKCNVAVRNFPESVSDIKRKWKLKDGGELYLFFTTNSQNEKIVIVSKKT